VIYGWGPWRGKKGTEGERERGIKGGERKGCEGEGKEHPQVATTVSPPYGDLLWDLFYVLPTVVKIPRVKKKS